ncbi:MAG: serine protease [Candidatus Staskawiczbacteria bacterium]|jgi:serine protease Do
MQNILIDAIKIIKPSVVPIAFNEHDIFTNSYKLSIVGTGFLYSKENLLIATCAHVISKNGVIRNDAQLQIGIMSENGPMGFPGKIISVDFEKDLAVIKIIIEKINPILENLSEIKLGDSSDLQEGQDIAFVGFPFGTVLSGDIRPSATRGIISAFRKNRIGGPVELVQLDAVTASGNSGAPVFIPGSNDVIAIIKGRFDPFMKGRPPRLIIDGEPVEIFTNIGFAQPINIAKDFLISSFDQVK